MTIKTAKDARKAVGAKPKEKICIGSQRVRAIFAVLKENYERFSADTASEVSFQGKESDALTLQKAYDEITRNKALSKKTASELRPVFRRMHWRFPNPNEDADGSTVFGPSHLWSRELRRRVAQLEADCRQGGSQVIEIEPDDASFLASVKIHIENDCVSDDTIQQAYRVLRKYERRV
jgi:hypothetical protein